MKMAERKKSPQFSVFLDPAEQRLAAAVKLSPFVKLLLWGGYEDAERKAAGFFPDFCEPETELFPLCALKISGAPDAGHRDYLGSIMGLGVKRASVGDIIAENGEAVIFCTEPVCELLLVSLERIGRQRVLLSRCAAEDITIAPRELDEVGGTVASLRLDAVTALFTRLSRTKAAELIDRELVSLNWSAVKNPSKSVAEGDVLSVRGYGRAKIGRIGGETKKGRIKITLLKDR